MNFKNAYDRFHEALFMFGKDKEPIRITQTITNEWTPFGAIKGDEAKLINADVKESYTILYRTNKGKFAKHVHDVSESAIVIKGKLEINTSKYSKVVNQGESFTVPAFVGHEVMFLEPTVLFMQFHPPFEKDWEAKLDDK